MPSRPDAACCSQKTSRDTANSTVSISSIRLSAPERARARPRSPSRLPTFRIHRIPSLPRMPSAQIAPRFRQHITRMPALPQRRQTREVDAKRFVSLGTGGFRAEKNLQSFIRISGDMRFKHLIAGPLRRIRRTPLDHVDPRHQHTPVRPHHHKPDIRPDQSPIPHHQLDICDPQPAPGKRVVSLRALDVWARIAERVGGGPRLCESTLRREVSPVPFRQRAHFLVARNADLQSLDRLNERFEALAAVPFHCVFANVSQADKNEHSNRDSHQDPVQPASPRRPFRRESHLSLILLTPGSE